MKVRRGRGSLFAAVVAVVLIISGAGCISKTTKKSPRVVAEVDRAPVTDEALRRFAVSLGPRGIEMAGTPAMRRQLLEDLIDRRLMANGAVLEDLDATPEFAALLGDARTAILADLYIKKLLQTKLTDVNLRAFFAAHQKEYSRKKVRAAHIVLRTEAEAAAVLKDAMVPGSDFAALARAHSRGGSASQGGDLGWFGRSKMLPDLEAAAFKTKKGEIYPIPVPTSAGWQVVKVLDTEGEADVAYDQVEEEVRAAFTAEAKADALRSLRANAEVTVDENAVRGVK